MKTSKKHSQNKATPPRAGGGGPVFLSCFIDVFIDFVDFCVFPSFPTTLFLTTLLRVPKGCAGGNVGRNWSSGFDTRQLAGPFRVTKLPHFPYTPQESHKKIIDKKLRVSKHNFLICWLRVSNLKSISEFPGRSPLPS